jgi:hypothetical protein
MPADNELPVWTIRPNWRNGIIERLEWLTDTMGSTYGTEQRRALRLSPRRSFDMTFNPIDSARSYFDLWLHRFGSDEFMVPLFHDRGKLTDSVLAGVDELPVDTTYREFVAGGMAVIIGDDPFTTEIVEIDAVAADTLTLAAGIGAAWGKGTAIYPLRRSRLAQESLFAALTSRVGEGSIQFELNQANDIPAEGAWTTLYEAVPVLTDEPNRRESLDLNYMRQALMLDNEVGLRHLLDDAGRAFTIQKHLMMMHGRAEHWAFRQMLYRLRGMAAPVWLPTFNRDLVLSQSRLAGDALIDIKKIGYAYTGSVIDGREHVLINGSIGRRITSVGAAPSTAEERLNLSAALGVGLPAGTTASFMDIVRMDSDAVEITHHTDTDGTAECTLAFRAFRDEREPDDVLHYAIPGTAARSAPCGEEFSQIINLDAEGNAVFPGSESQAAVKGVTISGFDPGSVLKLTLPPGQLYVAWSPWGRPAYNAGLPANSGSLNRVTIVEDTNWAGWYHVEVAGPLGTFGQFNGYEAARAAFGEQFITGASSYTFFIRDTPLADNTGGLSILVELV